MDRTAGGRTVKSEICTPRENCWRLIQTASKVNRLHAPILHLSHHHQHKAYYLRGSAHHAAKRAGHGIIDRTCVYDFLFITLAAHGCSEILLAAALLVQCSDNMFCQVLSVSILICQFQKIRNRQNMLSLYIIDINNNTTERKINYH